jgi:hypothetical protein
MLARDSKRYWIEFQKGHYYSDWDGYSMTSDRAPRSLTHAFFG